MTCQNNINLSYSLLLAEILIFGENIETRNHRTYSHTELKPISITTTPLVTVRRTAWKKAIREMEWFMSGEDRCPDELLDWWDGQLDRNNKLVDGYPKQFRHNTHEDGLYEASYFDQIKFILEGIKNSPNSRRLIITAWNPGEMAYIQETNNNHNTPTCCHATMLQFFVRNGKLHATHYQRSADMLLGVPHNLIQYWALMLYFAHHSGLEVGTLNWIFGDAHIYAEKSHIEVADAIINYDRCKLLDLEVPELIYNPSNIEHDYNGVPIFKANDFSLVGKMPEPIITTRPRLL